MPLKAGLPDRALDDDRVQHLFNNGRYKHERGHGKEGPDKFYQNGISSSLAAAGRRRAGGYETFLFFEITLVQHKNRCWHAATIFWRPQSRNHEDDPDPGLRLLLTAAS